jgi:hypothetical protein
MEFCARILYYTRTCTRQALLHLTRRSHKETRKATSMDAKTAFGTFPCERDNGRASVRRYGPRGREGGAVVLQCVSAENSRRSGENLITIEANFHAFTPSILPSFAS